MTLPNTGRLAFNQRHLSSSALVEPSHMLPKQWGSQADSHARTGPYPFDTTGFGEQFQTRYWDLEKYISPIYISPSCYSRGYITVLCIQSTDPVFPNLGFKSTLALATHPQEVNGKELNGKGRKRRFLYCGHIGKRNKRIQGFPQLCFRVPEVRLKLK